ncbi:MAG TPA: UDP-N-acetylmuramoyl-tripeptide--D-alanyl-D-alanine ligase [Acidimicrobiia bacterium]|nr:UDP-N-acetylmuramoyl-tripeptide--D-alanyl-D-alanine ligase [Acidimicrobiia bacterium]
MWLLVTASMIGAGIAALRWLRVSQREHYLPPAATRFAWRWWNVSLVNRVLGLAAVAGVIGSFFIEPSLGWLGLAGAIGPVGLGLRGRTSPLDWTPRLRRLALATGVLVILFGAWSVIIAHPGPAAASIIVVPRLVDAAAAMLNRTERRAGDEWVEKARARLAGSGARVVAITGSYGKTTTKNYLAHLIGGTQSVVASPASFNNRMGLARAINEQLIPGTSIFIAEMGTYGRGEIRELCDFVPPDVAVITAIGPVHLERFGSEEAIVEAKAEILESASVAVLNQDHPRLAELAGKQTSRVLTTSTIARTANVAVVDGLLSVEGEVIGEVGEGVFPGNVASAMAAAIGLGIEPQALSGRLRDLPVARHRREISRTDRGVTVIDDTYNSNPVGARAALDSLVELDGGGRRVVVTPGMVELGPEQERANREWAQAAAEQATDLVVVGHTNRRSLIEGADGRRALVTVVDSRPQAVEWVRANLEAGDAVLYENDLPDHYP